jgi:hypothetical protein
MKAVLVVLLFALTACALPGDLLKLAQCVVRSPSALELLPKVVDAVKSKDFGSLVTLALSQFPKVKAEVMDCMAEPVLKGCDLLHLASCGVDCGNKGDGWARAACLNDCRRRFCK